MIMFRYVDFQEMCGVRLKDLKSHTNAVGGKWGDDTWAALVKDNYEEDFNSSNEATDALESTQPKRSLLIPLSVFSSSQIMKLAMLLGQSDDFKKFGVDEETPSGVEDIRNSTQRSGATSGLILTDVSRIAPIENEEEEIVFDELQKPDDFIVDETEADATEVDKDASEDDFEQDTDRGKKKRGK